MCQKVYSRVLPLSKAIITVVWYLILNLGSSLIKNFCFLFVFFFLLICCLFNSISLDNWMKLLPTKKEKKITLFFSLSARPCSHRYWALGRREILATYFFAEELFVSLISVKFAIRLSLLQPSFQGPFLLFLRTVSLSFRRVGEDPGNEVVFTAGCRIEHKTVVQSSYKPGKISSNSPENCYWAMTADE